MNIKRRKIVDMDIKYWKNEIDLKLNVLIIDD